MWRFWGWPVTAPWDPMPSREWATIRTAIAGAWPEGLMRHDLRWWASRVRCGLDASIPSSRVLAETWGVGRAVARRVMRAEDVWSDPKFYRPTADPAPTQPQPTTDPADPVVADVPDADQPTTDPEPTQDRPTTSHRRGVAQPQSTEHKKTPLSNSATAESDPDTLTKTWEALQAIRKRHQPAARGQSLSTARRRNLRARLSELRKAGHDRGTLLHAGAWVFTSSNMHAEGARKTGDPIGTLLRAKHCLKYVELSIDGSAGPAVTVANGGDTAWQHIVTMTSRGDLAERIRSGRLGPDPAEHGRRLAAIKAAGGFPAFRMMGPFTERKIREAFQAAYAGGAA